MGSGCGPVGRAVAADSTGLQFESSHRQNLYWTFSVICIKKAKLKITRVREWPIKNQSFGIRSTDIKWDSGSNSNVCKIDDHFFRQVSCQHLRDELLLLLKPLPPPLWGKLFLFQNDIRSVGILNDNSNLFDDDVVIDVSSQSTFARSFIWSHEYSKWKLRKYWNDLQIRLGQASIPRPDKTHLLSKENYHCTAW